MSRFFLRSTFHISVLLHLAFAGRADAQSLSLTPAEAVLDTIAECETADFYCTLVNRDVVPFRIEFADITGPSAAEFALRAPILPYSLAAQDSVRLLVRLTPRSIGTKNASLRVRGSDSAILSNTTNLSGYVTRASLAYAPIGINFGPLYVSQSKRDTIMIINTGTKDITVTRLGLSGVDTLHFRILNNTAPFVMAPGDSSPVIIEFSPSDEGEFRAFLQVNSTDCRGLVTVISLDGLGARSTIATVGLPNEVRGRPGSTIAIPLHLENRIPDNPSNAYSFTLLYNPTTLLPVDVHSRLTGRLGYNVKWDIILPGILSVEADGISPLSEPGPLLHIVADVYLGNESSFPLKLRSFLFRGNRPFSITHDGLFILDSVCQIPRQLITRRGKAVDFRNHPNPFNPLTLISYRLLEDTRVTLSIHDPLGRGIQTLVDAFQTAGSYRYEFRAHNLIAGPYYALLRTGGHQQIRKILLLP